MKTHALIAALMISANSAALAEPAWQKTPTGIVVTPQAGPAKSVRLQLYGDRIVRVTEGAAEPDKSIAVIAAPATVPFSDGVMSAQPARPTAAIIAAIEACVRIFMVKPP